jgi:hypothetical protein
VRLSNELRLREVREVDEPPAWRRLVAGGPGKADTDSTRGTTETPNLVAAAENVARRDADDFENRIFRVQTVSRFPGVNR